MLFNKSIQLTLPCESGSWFRMLNRNNYMNIKDEAKEILRWNRFRFFRTLLTVSFPLVILFAILANDISAFFGYLAFFCGFLFCICVSYTTLWKCPQCKQFFCTKMTWLVSSNIPFRNTCIHCGYRPIQKDLDYRQ